MTMMKRSALCVLLAVCVLLWAGVYAQEADPTPPVQGPASDAVTTRPSDVQPDQPAVPITDVPSPAEPDHSKEQAMWALVGTFALQYLKKARWFTFITEETSGRIKAMWGFGLAFLTSAGINFSITGSFLDTTGATLTFTGVSLSAFKDIAWQWAAQQGWYRLIVKEPSVIVESIVDTVRGRI